jgi:hypothetical protein
MAARETILASGAESSRRRGCRLAEQCLGFRSGCDVVLEQPSAASLQRKTPPRRRVQWQRCECSTTLSGHPHSQRTQHSGRDSVAATSAGDSAQDGGMLIGAHTQPARCHLHTYATIS